ncbi:MAG: AAA family ATPase [Nocardioidaceae bacterium]
MRGTRGVGHPPVVVVTGVPGAGKTTLANAVAAELDALLLSLDAIKERMFAGGQAGPDRDALRRRAEAELAASVDAATGPVVVDIWVAPHRDTERVCRLLKPYANRVAELLCRVPADVAVERYRRRERGGPHLPADEATLQRVREAVDEIAPLSLGVCIEVDTSAPVELGTILDQLRL